MIKTQVSTTVYILRRPLPSDSEPVTLSRDEPVTLSQGGRWRIDTVGI